MEMEKPNSTSCAGSYIRRFVKQMSSTCPREVTDLISSDAPLITGDLHHADSPIKTGERDPAPQPLTPNHTQLPKKQVRRRLNATRPYKERLLDMAEARREIVKALKFHRNRAAMKQQSPPPRAAAVICNRRPPILPPFSYASRSWNHTRFETPLPIFDNNLTTNFTLPNQPLGLNLNFQDFIDAETPIFRSKSCSMPLTIHQPTPSSSSSSSSSYSTSPSSSYHSHSSLTVPPCAAADVPASPADSIPSDPNLHPVMGDEEMEEIRSMSEKHEMVWNDALNSASTAWWSKLLQSVDSGENREEGDAYQMFSEALMDTQLGWAVDYWRRNHLSERPMDDAGHQQDAALPWW